MGLAAEPPFAIMPRPASGWAPVIDRIELTDTDELSRVGYWLATEARSRRRGVVAQVDGVDCYAWPDQTVDEIIRTHLRLEEFAKATMPASGRWTFRVKAEMARLVAAGLVHEQSARARFRIGHEELAGWRVAA